MENTFFISTLIGMRTEVITLCLDQVSWQYFSTIAVIVGNGRREGRYRDAILNSVGNNITQRLLIFISDVLEVRI